MSLNVAFKFSTPPMFICTFICIAFPESCLISCVNFGEVYVSGNEKYGEITISALSKICGFVSTPP